MARDKRPRLEVVAATEQPSLDGYDEEFLECRGLSHPWRGVGFFRDGGFISRLVRCQRCGTEKIITMRANGAFVRSSYNHPEGYRIANGGVSKQDVRYEVIKRANVQTFDSLEALVSAKKPRRKSS